MAGKITWQMIYKEFRFKHPRLRGEVLDWRPHGYLTISVTLKDGTKMIYDYLQKRCIFTE